MLFHLLYLSLGNALYFIFQVKESHQATKVDTSGTAKAIVTCFQKLGVSFDINQVKYLKFQSNMLAYNFLRTFYKKYYFHLPQSD